MRNQAPPVCQSVFGLSLSLTGIMGALHISALCAPALASLTALESENISTINSDMSSQATASALPSELAEATSDPSALDRFDRGNKSQGLTGGSFYQPRFIAYCSSADCNTEIAELLTDPAMVHAGRVDIGLAAKSQTLDTAAPDLPLTQNATRGSILENVLGLPPIETSDLSEAPSEIPSLRDSIPREQMIRDQALVAGPPDEDLGKLRLQLQRSRQNEDLGVLRLLKTAQAGPPLPKQPIAYVSGRLGFLDSDNVFRSNQRIDEQVYQSGLTFFLFPELSESTNLYAIAGTSLARYERREDVNNNQVDFQLGIRQRLFPRTHVQLGWRNQSLYKPGYREKILGVNYIEGQLSHRSVLSDRTWIDGFYQARVGFTDTEGRPDTVSKFRQTVTVSLNHGFSRDLRTSLLYQVDLDNFTQKARYDTYHQILGSFSYRLTPETRLSLFGGTRFGRSSDPTVNLDDTFYGAGLNVTLPLF